MVGRKANAYAEESAEVEVLYANLEKLNGLTKKIQGSLNRLDTSRTNVDNAIGPVYGNTRKLQVTHRNIDRALEVIEKLRAPLENKDKEENIIRSDPKRVGVPDYVASLERADRALKGLKATNLPANQAAMREMGALVNYGNRQLEEVFKQKLFSLTENQIEPLHYITKGKSFPTIPDEGTPELRFINSYMARASSRSQSGGPGEFSTMKIFGDVRGTYVARSLTTSAAATMSTARKLNNDSIYRRGTCGIGAYCSALEGMLQSEFDNIKRSFPSECWSRALLLTARPALSDFAKTLRDLNAHIQSHMMTDCFLAYEVLELVSALARRLDNISSEVKAAVLDVLQPIHDTAKSSLSRMIDDIKLRVQSLQALPLDGSPVSISGDAISRLATLIEYRGPLATLMSMIGEGKWMSSPPNSSSPSIRSFDSSPNPDNDKLFVHYCSDTLETLINQLDSRSRLLHKSSAVQAVFMSNNVAVLENQLRGSELESMLPFIQPRIETWKSKYAKAYLNPWNACGSLLLDVTHTSRASRPASGGLPDSSAIVKSLNTKEKDTIKEKFRNFNAVFEELVAKHKTYKMEPSVRNILGKDIGKVIQPLYDRFWDRYHEVDKGKGKYVRYSKAELSVVLANMMM